MLLRLPILLAAVLALGACGVEADFSGHETYQVWRAMQAAAEYPDYDHQDYTKRWKVMENIVLCKMASMDIVLGPPRSGFPR